ncbi:pectate lyase [Bacillus sp. IITD106]|nr:pectate lyase [Bacillus sp. IITD106]
MNYKFPVWLDKWIQLDKTNDSLDMKIVEEKGNVAVVEVKWKDASTSLNRILLNMNLIDSTMKCVWKPHLCPEEEMVIGDLFFQSPAIIFEKEDNLFALVPDLDFIDGSRIAPHMMDYVEPERKLFYGLGNYEKTKHVYHKITNRPINVEHGQVLFRFYLVQWQDVKETRNFSPVTDFLWERFGEKRMMQNRRKQIGESLKSLEVYANHTYDWAFNRWEPIVWQEFQLGKKDVGGCVFIVRAAQTPGLGQEDSWREKKSIWNQAWFSSLRSAYGYRLWGERWNNKDMIRRSELAKNFALSAPQKNGLFPSVYWAGSDQKWDSGNWGHSDRRPENHDGFGHLLDMSWTCLWMLKWYKDIEQDNDLLDYARNYAKRLLELQQKNGSFPGWVHEETGEISPYLQDSPETSLHVWFLTSLYDITKEEKYLSAGLKGMDFVLKEIVPNGRWEDFETYWSCSRMWDGKQYGKKDPRSGLYNQCNFSIYWTTEALKALYLTTHKDQYLICGEQVLAELSLYQAIWEPKYVNLPVLGGFSVMTSDDEWNDARQSLFALTYLDYFKITGKEEYKLRSLWAMKASFYMMYCPENPKVKDLYEKTFPHFSELDYGFEMENAHHGENIDIAGEFTIFDWGNGSASSSLIEMLKKCETEENIYV